MNGFDLSALALRSRLEVAYVLQCRHDDRTVRVPPSVVRHLVALLADSGTGSLLDRPLEGWLDEVRPLGLKDPSRTIGLVRYAYRRLSDLGGIDIEAEYASDVWVASRLGIKVTRSPAQTSFDAIEQPWLGAAVKRWARLRLGSGKTFDSVHVDVQAMLWFSRFLTQRDPRAVDETVVTRDALESYLVWVTASHLAAHTFSTYITCLRVFLDACRRHGWLPRLAATAAIYHDDLPSRPRPLPRFIPEFVMAQLEDPERLAMLPDATTRALVIVITETGLRATTPARCRSTRSSTTAPDGGASATSTPRWPPSSSCPSAPPPPKPSGPNRGICSTAGPTLYRCCSPPHAPTPTRPDPSTTPRCAGVWPAGNTTSTCTTTPASPSGSPPTSSATPSAPG